MSFQVFGVYQHGFMLAQEGMFGQGMAWAWQLVAWSTCLEGVGGCLPPGSI
jgi:hypothetical protein